MATPVPVVRFGVFDIDFRTQELRKQGLRIKLPQQSFHILQMLLERPGELVTRDELRQALWAGDTFVDFDHGVNNSIKRIRDALGDSAGSPRYIETLPRLGYRFIGTIDAVAATPALVVPPATREVPQATGWRWRFGLFATGLLLLVVLGGFLLRPREKQPESLTITPFTTFPGFEIAPTFSPDGNQIAFSWSGHENDYRFELHVKQVGQERTLQLTHHPATFLASAWSPDGRSIAFMRQAEPDASGVYLISPLGGTERKLADITPYIGYDPIGLSWSPDSKWVAFAKATSTDANPDPGTIHFSIHLVSVATHEERALPAPSPECVHAWQPAFSPDGKYLASVCVLNWAGVGKIYVQTPDGKQAREVAGARSSGGFDGIAWTADGKSLTYSADEHLWRVPLKGGKPEKLLFAEDAETVSISRIGNRLAYGKVRHPGSIWQIEMTSQAKPNGPATKIISSSRGELGVRISPDGKHMAFQSWRSGYPEVWVCDRDTSNPEQLSSFSGPQVGSPNWSPDSRSVVFDVRDFGNAELYVLKLDGGRPQRLVTGTPSAANPFWSADGHWIYFNTERPDVIWKVPVGGGAALRLTGEGRFVPQESPDGTRVFFYRAVGSQHQVWSASVDGSDERPVTGMPADVGWALAQDGIYFIDDSSRHPFLNYFDFVTRHVRRVADLPGLPLIGKPAVSSDGLTILFAGIEQPESDIMLVDGFR